MEQNNTNNPSSVSRDDDDDMVMIDAAQSSESEEGQYKLASHFIPTVQTESVPASSAIRPPHKASTQMASTTQGTSATNYNSNIETLDEHIHKDMNNSANTTKKVPEPAKTDTASAPSTTNQEKQNRSTYMPTSSPQQQKAHIGETMSELQLKPSTSGVIERPGQLPPDAGQLQYQNGNINQTIPRLPVLLKTIRPPRSKTLARKQLWLPLNPENIPTKEEYDILESNFGRKIRFEHSISHSSSNEDQISVSNFSNSLKDTIESIMNIPEMTTRQRLSFIADQAKRHSNLGHRHLETLSNLLMHVIHDELSKVAKLSRLIDDLSAEILSRKNQLLSKNADHTEVEALDEKTMGEIGNTDAGSLIEDTDIDNSPLELDNIFAFILDRLMVDVLRREEMIEGLRNLRRTIVKLLQLNEDMFKALKRFRTKHQHHRTNRGHPDG